MASQIQIIKFIDKIIGRLLVFLCPKYKRDDVCQVKDVLFLRPGGIGDAILLIPAIRLLKSKFPDAAVDIIAEKRNAGVFHLCTQIDNVYRYDVVSEFLQVVRKRYDVVIDSEQWYRLSSVAARLIRSDMKIGFATNERQRMFSHGIPYSHEDYELVSFLRLLRPFGVAAEHHVAGPWLDIADSDRQIVKNKLSTISFPYVVIFPGASIAERRWRPERFAEVADCLMHKGYAVIVVGGGADTAAGDRIVSKCDGLNLAGKTTLSQTAAVLEGAALLISGDSGVLHMGVSLNIPAVSLFGPGIEKKWGPQGDHHIVINRHLTCSPCTRFGTTPKCPIGGRCIQEITPEDVSRAALSLLKRLPSDALCMRSKA